MLLYELREIFNLLVFKWFKTALKVKSYDTKSYDIKWSIQI